MKKLLALMLFALAMPFAAFAQPGGGPAGNSPQAICNECRAKVVATKKECDKAKRPDCAKKETEGAQACDAGVCKNFSNTKGKGGP